MNNPQSSVNRKSDSIRRLIESHFDLADESSGAMTGPKLIVESKGVPAGMMAISQNEIAFDADGMTIADELFIGWDGIMGVYVSSDYLELKLADDSIVRFESVVA